MVDGRYDVAGGGAALRDRLDEICAEVSTAIAGGAHIIVLSDRGGGRGADARLAPIPSLLLTGTVHHHLIRERTRTRAGLIVESGDARECHHIALLIGYGAAAVNPYLALQTVADMVRRGVLDGVTAKKATGNLVKALGKGLLKIMSKMGVSTVASYTGAQIFEAIGLGEEIISTCFTGTTSRLGGVGFEVLAAEAGRAARAGLPAPGCRPGSPAAGDRRRLPVAPRGRAAPVQPGDRVQAAARDPEPPLRGLQGVHPPGGRPVRPAHDAARPAAHPRRR